MNFEVINQIFSNLRLYIIITNELGQILWLSQELKDLLDDDTQNNVNIEAMFNIDLDDLITKDNIEINIGNNPYILNKIELENQINTVFVIDSITDYNDYKIKFNCLEEIIENLNDGILFTDRDGRIVIYNKTMEDLEKRKAKDMIGKYIWDAYGYKDINKSEHMQVFNSGIPIINKYKAHAYDNGNPIYKSYSTFPIKKDEETIGVYSISEDETKLQSLLSESIELKRQLRGTLEDEKCINSNGTRFTFSDIIGSSYVMKNLINVSQSISWLDNNILIVGSTGTGKEVLAQSIHNYGKRESYPFVGVNCSAIPENLLESILFGTRKGAYTGAIDSTGLFQEAGEGTLFLDELDSMPINMQTKLLRILQEKSARPVGGKEEYEIKCRVISSMGRDPYNLIEKGKLREDLFYRVAGYNLYLPDLKERENDLFELTEYYIGRNNKMMNKNVYYISEPLRRIMGNYNWPGNVRQLEHFIENIMVRTHEKDNYLRIENVPEHILENMVDGLDYKAFQNKKTLQEKLDDIEKKLIIEGLESNKWNVTKTAEKLGITRQSLNYRMRKLSIKRD